MCTPNKKWAKGFSGSGQMYYILPLGKINYTWIESTDFHITTPKTGWRSQAWIDFINDEKDPLFPLPKPFADYFHTNKDFDIAYKNGYELWFKCKSYYYVNASTYEIEWNTKEQVFE